MICFNKQSLLCFERPTTCSKITRSTTLSETSFSKSTALDNNAYMRTRPKPATHSSTKCRKTRRMKSGALSASITTSLSFHQLTVGYAKTSSAIHAFSPVSVRTANFQCARTAGRKCKSMGSMTNTVLSVLRIYPNCACFKGD